MADNSRLSKLKELRDLRERQGNIEGAAWAELQIRNLQRSGAAQERANAVSFGNVPNFAVGIPGTDINYVNSPKPGQGGYGGGLVTMGAGFDRLVTGARELGMQAADALVPPQGGNPRLQELREGYAARREAYEPLAESIGGAAQLGEIVGESAPFVSAPVPAILRGGASLFDNPSLLGRGVDQAARLIPEFVAGGTEAAIPIDPNEGRLTRFMEGGGTAAAVGRVTDVVSQRASAKRGIARDPATQEMFDLARETGVPIRSGSLENQLKRADDLASGRATTREPGEIGEDIVAGAQEGMGRVEANFGESYKQLFRTMDQHGASLTDLRPRIGELIANENAKGSHKSKALLKAMRKWIKTPEEGLTVEALHNYRDDLRAQINTLGPRERKRLKDWQKLEQEISNSIYLQADAINADLGSTLRNLDRWYYEDLAALKRAPGVQSALGDHPSPVQVSNWFTSKPSEAKRRVFDSMTDTGKQAVLESIWNNAYRAGSRGKEFNPLNYAKYVEDTAESAKHYMSPTDYQAFVNTGKLMRYIAKEGKTADIGLMDIVKGYPLFLVRRTADSFKKANWRWKMAQAPADIRPESPEMERFYRSVVRGLAIQDGEELQEGYGGLSGYGSPTGLPPARELR